MPDAPLADADAEFLRGEVRRLTGALAASEASRARLVEYIDATWDHGAAGDNLGNDVVTLAAYEAAGIRMDAARAALTESDLVLSQDPPDPSQDAGNVSQVGSKDG